MQATEYNFDGLVGPTHNYAGLSFGNVASAANRAALAHPRAAALQGLAKMRALLRLGVPQAVLPPHERPDVAWLRTHGFAGDDRAVLDAVRTRAPELLATAGSASAMWTANAATGAPSADTADRRVHLVVANLAAKPHRALEAPQTERTLRAIFRDDFRFAVHAALPSVQYGGDEGAANHTRFCAEPGGAGVHLFVYGENPANPGAPRPRKFPARQARRASEAVAHALGVREVARVFAQQNPAAIDAGAFHHDVVGVGHRDVHLLHEDALLDPVGALAELERAFRRFTGEGMRTLVVSRDAVPLADAVGSYLFNSQLVTTADGALALVAPAECATTPSVRAWLDAQLAEAGGPIRAVRFFDLRESMRNGGGPACLRLRVVLTPEERAAAAPGVFLDESRIDALEAWVHRHYREDLSPAELGDPALLDEVRRALDELTRLLGLGAIYPFQLG